MSDKESWKSQSMSVEESSGRKRKQISYAENVNNEAKRKKLPKTQSNINSRHVSSFKDHIDPNSMIKMSSFD